MPIGIGAKTNKVNIKSNYYLKDHPSGTRMVSTGMHLPNGGGDNIVKRSKFYASNPHSRFFNDWKTKKFNSIDPEKERRRSIKPALMKGNQGRGMLHLQYFTYEDTGKRYLGNQHYVAGDGEYYVDDKMGRKFKLKLHTVRRHDVIPRP